MSKLRVAVYHNLHSGGAKRVVAEQLDRLSLQHFVKLFTLSSADQSFATNANTTTIPTWVARFKPLPLANRPFGRVNPLVRLTDVIRLDYVSRYTAKKIDQEVFDVVLIHPCQVTQAPLILRSLQTPSLYYCHELPRRLYEKPPPRSYLKKGFRRHILDQIDPLKGSFNTIMRRLDHYNARCATRIITNSSQTRADVAIVYNRDAAVCSPGVAWEVFTPVELERERLVLSVGALTPVKGFDFIIQALGTLPVDQRPRLVLVNNYQEPDELKYLQLLAQQHGVALESRARVTDDELHHWYTVAGCMAYAPLREPFGLVVLEAMAAGLPVVCVAEGGILETVINNVTGLLTPREPEMFGRAIDYILTHNYQAQQMSQAAQRRVQEHWTWKQHIRHLEGHLVQTASTGRMVGSNAR